VFAHSVDLRDNSVENYTISGRRQKNHHEEEPATPTREDTNNGDEKYGAESRFVPSFGPFQPPEQYYDSPSLHTFSSSPILAYRYMFNHGYPYACHFPYSKYVTPFRPSASDYFLATHKSASSHFPQAHVTYPYAEEYNHYLPHAGSYTFPYPSHQFGVELHHGSFYPPHPASYSYLGVPQPPVSLRSRGTPHEFHSVVNYGHINLHHGDHFEPHNNGKTIPHHYPGKLVYRSRIFETRIKFEVLFFKILVSMK
jgi:hypothetical protein